MTNKAFYAFCRDRRKVESHPEKRTALKEVYHYMWECGVTKEGVASFVAVLIARATTEAQIAAYQWLLNLFQDKGVTSESPTTGALSCADHPGSDLGAVALDGVQAREATNSRDR